ncbi:Hydroxypyruvate isomerase [Rosistilla ulvae]|uniref:Hydroxypyruvate isomerase n=1 Tax=Rosistilla ulvae TaxID=1930277 RepID=A0A517M731_9BACT|nr:TIM barrel protein [Rosistilla ulvae]QDS90597.1 Hydroxypyruvate isomerase [Rosistilla ulvae]
MNPRLKLQPSVCIDAIFEGLPAPQAIQTVADCGIKAFEFWGWWDRDLDAILSARDLHELTISACCTKFISLVDPAWQDDYLAGLEASLSTAQRLGCQTLISQVGDFRPGIDRQQQLDCLVDGLKRAAPMLQAAEVTLVIEPLNELVDHPGYFLIRSDEAFAVVDRVDSDRVKVVFDIYHQQISEGNVIENITRNIAKIGHFHAAGNPGRHELTRGELHYPSIFTAIVESGFEGFVGLEYWPKDDPATGLRQVASWF